MRIRTDDKPVEIKPHAVYKMKELPRVLRIHRKGLEKMVKNGELPSLKINRTLRFFGEDIINFLKSKSSE